MTQLSPDQLQWLSLDLADAGSECLEVGQCIAATARLDMSIALHGPVYSINVWDEAYAVACRACRVEGVFGFVVERSADGYEVRGPSTWDPALGKVVKAEGARWGSIPLWRGHPDGSPLVVKVGPRLRASALAERLERVTRLVLAS